MRIAGNGLAPNKLLNQYWLIENCALRNNAQLNHCNYRHSLKLCLKISSAKCVPICSCFHAFNLVTDGFPLQMASNAESVSASCCHHAMYYTIYASLPHGYQRLSMCIHSHLANVCHGRLLNTFLIFMHMIQGPIGMRPDENTRLGSLLPAWFNWGLGMNK